MTDSKTDRAMVTDILNTIIQDVVKTSSAIIYSHLVPKKAARNKIIQFWKDVDSQKIISQYLPKKVARKNLIKFWQELDTQLRATEKDNRRTDKKPGQTVDRQKTQKRRPFRLL